MTQRNRNCEGQARRAEVDEVGEDVRVGQPGGHRYSHTPHYRTLFGACASSKSLKVASVSDLLGLKVRTSTPPADLEGKLCLFIAQITGTQAETPLRDPPES
jgi:hypothetical protein